MKALPRSLLFGVPLLLFAALALLLWRGLSLDPRKLDSPLVGRPAPVFALPEHGSPQRTGGPQNYRGQVWLLNVWASWCAVCIQEHPFLTELARNSGIPLVGLNWKDPPDNAARWLARWGDPYRVSYTDLDGRAGIDWGVYGAPETFLIDKQGTIRYKHVGELTPAVWQKEFMPRVAQWQ